MSLLEMFCDVDDFCVRFEPHLRHNPGYAGSVALRIIDAPVVPDFLPARAAIGGNAK